MNDQIRFDEDWHVHSTYSDGVTTVEENLAVAEARGLRTICMVDHVRRTSGWVGDFVDDVRRLNGETSLSVGCGVEAKILDTSGALDIPAGATVAADRVFAADHQLPTPRGPMDPAEARAQIEAGKLLPMKAIEWLVRGSVNAVRQYDNVVLAHPFSILPKLGLDEGSLYPAFVHWLAGEMAEREAETEISERWLCPSPWVLAAFLRAGVTVHASTDSHTADDIGVYRWSRAATARLEHARPLDASLAYSV